MIATSSPFKKIMAIYFLLFIGLIGYGLFRIFIKENVTIEVYKYSAYILISWYFIDFTKDVAKEILKFIHKQSAVKTDPCKYNYRAMLLGLAGCIFFGFLPRILVFFVVGNEMLYLLTCCVPFYGAISWYSSFCSSRIKKFLFFIQWTAFPTCLIIFINIFLFFISIWIASELTTGQEFKDIVQIQVFYSVICLFACLEFYTFCVDNLAYDLDDFSRFGDFHTLLRNDTMKEMCKYSDWARSALEEADEEHGTPYECSICVSRYDQINKIPRILKECGHTICEECADELLEESTGQHLFCPFCKAVTLVKDDADELPKNFTILDLMNDEVRQKRLQAPIEEEKVEDEKMEV